MTPEKAFWLMVLVISLVILGLISTVWGHGHAEWIMKSPDTGWCCGPKDCEPVMGRLAFVPEGPDGAYRVEGWDGTVSIGERGFYRKPTPDHRPWACRNIYTNKLRCVIVDGADG